MAEHDIDSLLEKYHAGRCSLEERAFIHAWYNHQQQGLPEEERALNESEVRQRIWMKLKKKSLQHGAKYIKLWPSIAAACLLIISGLLYIKTANKHHQAIKSQQAQHDVPPGTNRAVLALANGQQVVLDTAAAGGISLQDGVQLLNFVLQIT